MVLYVIRFGIRSYFDISWTRSATSVRWVTGIPRTTEERNKKKPGDWHFWRKQISSSQSENGEAKSSCSILSFFQHNSLFQLCSWAWLLCSFPHCAHSHPWSHWRSWDLALCLRQKHLCFFRLQKYHQSLDSLSPTHVMVSCNSCFLERQTRRPFPRKIGKETMSFHLFKSFPYSVHALLSTEAF